MIKYKIEEKKFSELGFRERDHLQEWLAAEPKDASRIFADVEGNYFEKD